MAVERASTPFLVEELPDEEFEIEVDGLEGEDDFEELPDEEYVSSHDENLVTYLEDSVLQSLAAELLEDFEADKQARRDWARTYVEGLDLLGLKAEERSSPWPGAAGVFHPMLTEAVVRFQAQAMGELFPAAGPVRSKVVGKATPDVTKQAARVENELNYLLTEEMTDYRDELEQMLFQLPLAGSAFKKVYFDPVFEQPRSVFVPAEDFVAPYGASDLTTCERYTHVMKKSPVEVLQLQAAGFYDAVELPDPAPEMTDIQEKYSELAGEGAVMEDDDRHTILEMHVTIEPPEGIDDEYGTPCPYIVTIEKSSRTVLSMRRNWYEDDPKHRKRVHFAHYKYLPGMGFYGMGLIHLIGGLAKSATSILRQLIDAGTLSNIPAGFKAKGARIKGDDTPLTPGEFRDIDVPGATIRDSLMPLPFKEPSTVLYQLLGNIVNEGRRIGSVADIDIGNMNPEAPVGTTLALMERSMKVMSGVQARLHASMRRELGLIAAVVRDFMGPEYAYSVEEGATRAEDFNDRVDVLPVSDPNAATMSQRVVQYQAALQLSQQAPQFYDLGKLHRGMLEALNIPDAEDIIKLPDDVKPMDPVTENMAMLNQEAVKAFQYQDHEAHIRVHMAAAEDPKIRQLVGQSPMAAAIQAAMAAHITEHVAMAYRAQIQEQLGVALPDPEEDMPPEVELEISRAAADAAGRLLNKHEDEAAQQAREEEERDPLTHIQRAELQLKEREMALKEAEAKHDAALDAEKLKLEAQKIAGNLALGEEKLEADIQKTAANVAAKLATEVEKTDREDRHRGADLSLKLAEKMAEEEKESQRGAGDAERDTDGAGRRD